MKLIAAVALIMAPLVSFAQGAGGGGGAGGAAGSGSVGAGTSGNGNSGSDMSGTGGQMSSPGTGRAQFGCWSRCVSIQHSREPHLAYGMEK